MSAFLIPDMFDPTRYGLFDCTDGEALATIVLRESGRYEAFMGGECVTYSDTLDLADFADLVWHLIEAPREARNEECLSLGLFE